MRVEPRARSGGILPRSRPSRSCSRSFERATLEASAMTASWGNYSSEAAEEAELAEDSIQRRDRGERRVNTLVVRCLSCSFNQVASSAP